MHFRSKARPVIDYINPTLMLSTDHPSNSCIMWIGLNVHNYSSLKPHLMLISADTWKTRYGLQQLPPVGNRPQSLLPSNGLKTATPNHHTQRDTTNYPPRQSQSRLTTSRRPASRRVLFKTHPSIAFVISSTISTRISDLSLVLSFPVARHRAAFLTGPSPRVS